MTHTEGPQHSAIFAAGKPSRFKVFEVVINSRPRLAIKDMPCEKPAAYKPAVAATLTIEVKKPTVANAIQWIFEGIEYARAPIAGELVEQHVQNVRQLIRKTGIIMSEPNTFQPGEIYTFPIEFSIPADSLPSHRSEYCGIRYTLGCALIRPDRTDTAWYKFGVSKECKPVRCETLVHVGTVGSSLPPPSGTRAFAKVGDSTVAIVLPAYIALKEEDRVSQTLHIDISVVAGSAQLQSANLKFRELIPNGYRSRSRVHGAAFDAMLAMDGQMAVGFKEARLLLEPVKTVFSETAGVSTATIPVEIPAGAYMVWHNDIDTGSEGFVKCSHSFEIEVKGVENGKSVKGNTTVPIRVYGGFACTVRDMFDYWEV
ncbi:hypothetical protein HDU86_002867 [Geranomyces michiganensis]|nr:hypothetical protein HDU86_002867 [Geranomyces michiganensis]